ncbi:LacI family DNA-binding transcriptional regulator [Rubellicoccus peritrichatus]|uniref:LacI family DNA-binding transcriptional regulator n=1 Tax=Rubellicoccus peritrichatus TaxID=3080537 RepID=A0AAQ3L4Q3_9BACT|nr:LacI family DNA-binding transcriptional regulator [Puniceicoccus sp. CR14]WOO39314.1 LacI family DNA-binding transcriptional regulator [Puniceicoccus sp. CR14]
MVKLIDIAERLNLSRMTVSSVLNNRYRALGISEATAERVIETAKDMGYRRNQLAMAVKTGKTFTLGIIIGDEHIVDWIGEMLKGAFDAVRETDYSVKVDVVPNSEDVMSPLSSFLGHRVEGILGINLQPPQKTAMKFRQETEKYGLPLICSNSHPDLSACEVEPDHEGGAILAMKHLAELGHKKIAYIGGDSRSEAGIRRKQGFLKSLEELHLGLQPGHILECEWKIPKAEAGAEQLLKNPKTAPTAILCGNDEMAVAAIRRARKMGYRVPDDISVIGFSNEPLSILSDPPLTVIDMHHEQVGKKSFELLIESVDKKTNKKEGHPLTGMTILPTTLVQRESTAPPKKK